MTARQVMEQAISHLGVKESPPESNNVLFNTHYYGREVRGNFPWCCVFVWDVFRMAGAGQLFFDGERTAYCPAVQTWARKNGLTVDKKSGQYGDIILLDWNGNDSPDHMGLVEKRNADGGYVTIEGNTAVGADSNGGQVMRRVRYPKEICCMIRPQYREDSETGEKAPGPGEKAPARYGRICEVTEPEYRKTLDRLVEKGILKGLGGTGEERIIDLSRDFVRLLVLLDRAAVFGK